MKFLGIFVMLLVAAVSSVRGQQSLSEEEIEEILNAHNYYRSIVDPIPSNMLKLVRWTSKLQLIQFDQFHCIYNPASKPLFK